MPRFRSPFGIGPLTSLLLVAGAISWASLDAQEVQDAGPNPVVAVMDFTNSTLVDHQAYEPAGVGISGLLIAELQKSSSFQVVERERIEEVLDEIGFSSSSGVDARTAAVAGRMLGAHHLVFGVFVIDRGGNLRIDARAVNVETAKVEHVETVIDEADNLLGAVERLGRQLSTNLALPVESAMRSRAAPSSSKVVDATRVTAHLKFARAVLAEDLGDLRRAHRLYSEFLVSSRLVGHFDPLRSRAEQAMRTIESRVAVASETHDPPA